MTVALVMADASVRPIPLHSMELIDRADTARRIPLRTELSGSTRVEACAGRYQLRSSQPVSLNDSTYHWDLAVEIKANERVELTNANATAVAARKAAAARQVAPERDVFERVKRGVFRVEAGLGHGSGFLAQLPGIQERLVITNDHVVANDTAASVYLDSVTRVPAIVVSRDRDADLAALRLHPNRCSDCPALALVKPSQNEPLVVAGERVLAIGFPLNQEMTLTTGIASSVRDGAIISDVNINHGNSGGPMLNLAGEVVGVNAFGDFTSQGGPGISGAIAVTRMRALLDSLPTHLAKAPVPQDRLLTPVPRTAYPLAALKVAADTVDPKHYRKLLERNANKFTINITTPVLYRVAQRLVEDEVGGDRKKREKRGGVSKDQGYSELKLSRDWEQYVGDASVPVVTVAISPKVGETFGSAFRRGLVGVAAKASYVFQGDVRGARFYRNGVEVEPIRGGHGPQVANVDNVWIKLKDVADMGYYVLLPEAFSPDSTGAPARITIVIHDLKNPGTLSSTEIDGESSARVWNDFRAYYSAMRPDVPWREANPGLRSPRVPLSCDSFSGTCSIVP